MEKTKNQTKNKVSSQLRDNKAIPVAVIGMGCLFPGSKNSEGYWRDITAGRNMVTEVPSSHFLIDHYFDPDPSVPDKTYCRQGAFLSPIEFDPMAFGIPPTNLEATDTSQLLSLLVARQVLENAFNGQLKHIDRSRIGVIMGVAAGLELLGEMANRLVKPNWVKGMREAGLPEDEVQDICERIMATHAPWKESTFPGLLGNVVSGRIANCFDLGGINCTSDAACASSFSALSQGLNELYAGTSDVVIVGGADTNNDTFLFVSFSKTPALSPTHDCRPFSDKADGMVLGEGIGMIAIKRLDDAERDGDRIYAVIRGIGASSDGKGTSIYAPCAQGQAVALRRCYEAASYSPETVELLEAHGTATKPGDKAEVEALKTVFGDETLRKDKQWCALGSVKSQIGHTKSAAATAGIIKAVMGLHHKVLPPTIKVKQPNPLMEIEKSPFYLNTECRPWVRDDVHPRRASISSFGFGGTNFHVTVEEYKGPGKAARRLRNVPSELVVMGAENAKGLETLCRETAKDLGTEGVLTYLARTSQENLDASCPARLAVVATDEKDLETKLNYAAKTLSEKPDSGFSLPNGLFCSVEKTDPGLIAFLFPGQGTSGCLDMGADLAMQFSDAMKVWDFSASFDRKRGAKEPLHKVVYPMPVFNEEDKKAQSKKLAQTQWAQPAVMVTSLSMSSILKGLGIKPDCVGGHSLGEITALQDAGVLDMESLLTICFKRGELMAEAAKNPGTMTAVLCDVSKAQDILDKADTRIIIANHNSPSQIVLSGPVPDMEAVEAVLKKEKIKFRRLPVSAAFHSSLMTGACAPFLSHLKEFDFKKPSVPIYSNISGKPHQNRPDKIREALAKQIVSPVQFVKEIEEMHAAGARTFIEVGAGCVLTNCVVKILKNKPHFAVNIDTKSEHGITSLWKALAKLFIAGVTPDFSYLWEAYEPVSDPRKKEKPRFSVTLSGTNYGKPYPPPGGIKDYPKPNPPKTQIVPQTVAKEPEPLKTKSNITQNTMTDAPVVPRPEPPSQAGSRIVNENPSYHVHDGFVHDELRTDANQEQASVTKNSSPLPLGNAVRKDNSTWMDTYQHIQQQTTEAHSAYLKVMAESHLSFLKAAESSNMAFSALLTGQPADFTADLPTLDTRAGMAIPDPEAQTWPVPEYSPSSAPTAAPPTTKPAAAPLATEPVQAASLKNAPVETVPAEAAPVQATPSLAEQASVSPDSSDIDFTEMLLDVVSEKTGYPKEILTMDMDLELDLGIDSIKRVEIFSAINEENPWLPEVDPAVMAEIKTLGDVIAFIEQQAPQTTDSPAQPAAAPVAEPIPATPASAPGNIDFTEMLLDVVSEKTGYPKEILTMDMDLELDLGIDSIKRVEIFSAINEENPWLPEVDPAVMAEIKTLGDVIAFIEQQAPQTTDSPAQPAAAPVAEPIPATPASAPGNIDFTEMLLDVVSEKTGYPKEILTMDMDLELDLGIDSIKRVEIFSAINEENPWLPEVDPAVMAEIKTLGDVIAFIEQQAPQTTDSPAQPAAAPVAEPIPATPASAPGNIDFTEMLLDVVSEKTGYPKEILTMDMDLELDLGIDSIKRVEIFSAINEENPWLPEVDPAVMAEIKTLGDVIAFIEQQAPQTTDSPAQPAAAPVAEPIPATPASAPGNIDFTEMLLDVVSEKTGYPKEILTMDMDLELDLGIDSIKRVEIFSAINEENPWLPEVDPAVMAEIKTLGDVIAFIERSLGSVSNHENSSATAAAPVLETQTQEQGLGIGRYILRETPVPCSGFAMPGLTQARHMCIVNDETGIADALSKELEKNGICAAIVKEVPEDCDGLIFLGGLRKIENKRHAMDINREAFIAAKQIAGPMTAIGGIFVTVQNTGGDFGLSGQAGDHVWLSGLTGLVKTAGIEWPKASVKAIDIDINGLSAKQTASVICTELLTGGPEQEVGIKSDGRRFRLRSYSKSAGEAGTVLDENSVIVASGGARGITAKTLIQLAKDVKPRLALIGRTELLDEPECCRGAKTDAQIKAALLANAKTNGKNVTPMDLNKLAHKILSGREIKSNLEAMRQAGSEVRYIVADVTSKTDISNALKSTRKKWGAITGIVHGAGVLADKLIAEKTLEQFDRVFNTKVKGLEALLNATAKDDLNIICLFSSIAGRTGNMGQSDYAMANEILNKVADAEAVRRNGKCSVKSINWGPWDSGMVSPLLKAHFEEAGIPLIPVDLGAKQFVKEISEDAPENVEIVIGPAPPDSSLGISRIPRELNLSLLVNKSKYPFIDSHRIQDTPIVPVAMVLEWFSRTAELYNPDMKYVGCTDLKVLRGIKLSNFINGSDLFTVNCRQVNGDRAFLNLALMGSNGNGAHYAAKIEMSLKDTTNKIESKAKENGLPSWKWDVSEIYKNMLFHGPEFQVIKSLKGVSDQSATAVLGGVEKMAWPEAPWKFDVAALDGGLQLAILWGIHNLNKKSLPTKIGACYTYCNGPIAGPIDCVLTGKSMQNGRTVSDIAFFDNNGKLAAKLCDVEMHVLPDSTTQGHESR